MTNISFVPSICIPRSIILIFIEKKVCLLIYIYIYIHTHIYTHTHTHMCVCVCVSVSVCAAKTEWRQTERSLTSSQPTSSKSSMSVCIMRVLRESSMSSRPTIPDPDPPSSPSSSAPSSSSSTVCRRIIFTLCTHCWMQDRRWAWKPTENNSNNNNNNNNNNCIQRCNSRFFRISSLHREPSPTHPLKWARCNHVQITCNTSSVYHMQHVVLPTKWYKGTAQLLSLTEFKSIYLSFFFLYFIGWTINRFSSLKHTCGSCSTPVHVTQQTETACIIIF